MTTNPRTPSTPEEQEEVITPVPETAHADAARRLTNEARGALTAEGHSESQIREWAEEYVSENDANADLPDFLTWVAEHRS